MSEIISTLPVQAAPVAQAKAPAGAAARPAANEAAGADEPQSFSHTLAKQMEGAEGGEPENTPQAPVTGSGNSAQQATHEMQGDNILPQVLPPVPPAELLNLAQSLPGQGVLTASESAPLEPLPVAVNASATPVLITGESVRQTQGNSAIAGVNSPAGSPFNASTALASNPLETLGLTDFPLMPKGEAGVSTDVPKVLMTAANVSLALPQTELAGNNSTQPSVIGQFNTSAPNTQNAPLTTQVAAPLHQPGWEQAFAQQVAWIVKQDVQGAELRINPPHLGAVEMRVVINGDDQASVSFTSQHALVREAIEAAIPRLRDMLSTSGLNLVDVNVSQHSFAQQRHDSGRSTGADSLFQTENATGIDDAQPALVTLHKGMGIVDFYA